MNHDPSPVSTIPSITNADNPENTILTSISASTMPHHEKPGSTNQPSTRRTTTESATEPV
ncbi:hypothetical protein [Arthrobacter sp. W4I7]|uniref:hypothetical protein n=1 Tax=Arthrobacter sp. W4I7 TaxID=3042296 RepID=UPI00278B4222|nr:hypothetical protein [Arthrobacter sp. W4I7]MDQ0691419.1 hypothetical protein [Arthrobacter sp. W4I7]